MGTVLVVDDDTAVCKLVSAVLARDGLSVESVESGQAALDRLAGGGYALVLTDMTMPGMSGLEMIRAAEELGYAVPFLVMSAYLSPERERAVCDDPAVAGIIRKPFDIAQLVSDVRAVLDARQVPSAAAIPSERAPSLAASDASLALVPLELFALAAEALRPRRLRRVGPTVQRQRPIRPVARPAAAEQAGDAAC